MSSLATFFRFFRIMRHRYRRFVRVRSRSQRNAQRRAMLNHIFIPAK
jgi:hypothetical protein